MSVNAGSWQETNGNPGTGATAPAFMVDTVTPSVTVTTNNTDVNLAHGTATISFAFSEAPNSLSLGDTTASGGVLSNLSQGRAAPITPQPSPPTPTPTSATPSVGVTAGSWSENNGNPGAAGNTESLRGRHRDAKGGVCV